MDRHLLDRLKATVFKQASPVVADNLAILKYQIRSGKNGTVVVLVLHHAVLMRR